MKRRSLIPLGFVLLAGVAALLSSSSPPARAADATSYLPDTFAIARIDGKPIRVDKYVRTYFDSYAEFRPRPDSAGRVEFLKSMINKEVMARVAARVNRPLDFVDRVRIREETERTLSNVLFQRAVLDSAFVSEDEVKAVYETYKYDQHLRQIIFDDKPTAERVRSEILAGKTKWDDAVRRYHHAERDTAHSSDIGWVSRTAIDPGIASMIFALQPGEISPVIYDNAGYRITQAVERRAVQAPAFAGFRRSIARQIKNERAGVLAKRLQAQVGASIGLTYEMPNIQWAAVRFGNQRKMEMQNGAPRIEINAALPEISAEDTSRVLARWNGGQLTLSGFIHSFTELTPLARPDVGDPEAFRTQVDGIVLTPFMAKEAERRGLDKDSLAVVILTQRREQIAVEHLYEDSISSRVYVTPKERRKYYNDHIAQFFTYPRVTFAAIVRDSKASADSLAAALKAGAKAVDILRADSLAGHVSGSIQERSGGEQGAPYQKILFNELRPGQATVTGPDKEGTWMVLQQLTYDPGRQLSFAESEVMVAESLQNIRADERLQATLARWRKRYRIESHPELVMRILLSDPTALD